MKRRRWHAAIRRAATAALLAATAHAAADTLERGNGPEPSTLDAHRCQEVACGNVLRDLYEGLVAESAEGRLVPGMAERWEVSDDGRHYRFHLREGLRWSDGTPLDAHAVVASFRRAFEPATAAPFAQALEMIEHAPAIQRGELPPERLGVHAPDARTVAFRLTRSAPLPALLTLPIAFPVRVDRARALGAEHTRPGNLVSNGAYRLVAWTPQASLTLERNPAFHDAANVRIPRVRFHVTEDASSELKRFAAGGLDITEVVPPQPLAGLRARFGEQLRIAPYLGSFWLGLNLERPPFRDNPALREALSLAIDRDILTRHVTALGEQPAYGIVPPGIDGHAPAALPWADMSQSERVALARQRYREAGYGDDRPLTVELRYNTSTPHRRLALAVAAMWRETLGVRTRLRNEEWRVFVQNRRQRAITEAFRGGWIMDVEDPRSLLANFVGDTALNWSGYRDPDFEALLAAADAAPDAAARSALLREAEARLLDAHAVIPLYYYTSKHLVAPRVGGWQANPLDRHPTRHLDLDGGAAR
ncbi:peptide ABC transporter substrate-binding protein [Coralloluteibacterium thermophilus]|uniref:Peptide ABC transporter substrate-binding protein n=1 Tax=Coralloluteibacterium thermophilum TaxID=2707049 RepID=A0ABV9NMK2_9GAMM